MTKHKWTISANMIPIVLLYFCALLNFFTDSSFSIVIGTIILTLMVVIWINGYTLYMVPLVIIGNDALGTVLFGRLSFDVVLVVLIVIGYLAKINILKNVDKRILWVIGFYLFYFLYMSISDFIPWDQLFTTFLNFVLIVYTYSETKDDSEKLSQFLALLGITVFLTALSMVVVGGHQTLEVVHDGNIRIETFREGLLGAGAGDPNFSALRLLLGFICILTSRRIKALFKVPMLLVIGFAMIKTISMTLIVVAILTLFLTILTSKSLKKIIRNLLVVAAIAFGGLFFVQKIPDYLLPSQVDFLKFRIIEKYLSLVNGDLNNVTSNRLIGSVNGLNHFSQGSLFQVFCGFNPYLTHNTYVDLLNFFGIVGTVILIVGALRKFIIHIKYNRENENYLTISSLKILYLLYCYTLSIYTGVEYCLMTLFLFMF